MGQGARGKESLVNDITVVIPVRSDPLLSKAIESTPPEVEVIVAMTAPPAAAVEAALRLGKNRNLRVEISDVPGMSAGVNLGARSASHEKIVMLDSDCRLLPGALEAYSKGLDENAFVRGVTIVEREGFWSRIAALGTERLNTVFAANPRFFGPSIAFRKTDFLALGGYDEAMIHGSCDHEFALRLERANRTVFFSPEARIVHKALTYRIDTVSHVGYGRGMAYIDRKYGGRYGLSYCLKRLAPRELYTRAVERGGMSVIRSVLLGGLMLWGYLKDMSAGKR